MKLVKILELAAMLLVLIILIYLFGPNSWITYILSCTIVGLIVYNSTKNDKYGKKKRDTQ